MTNQLRLSKFLVIADIIIEWGIIFLLVSTPLALPTRYGSVHLWVYTTIELTVFLLVIIWLLKRTIIAANPNSELRTPNTATITPNSQIPNLSINRFGFAQTPLNLPIILFVGLIIFQLVPLPSGILNSISPNTYYLYRMTLPGWPADKVVHVKSLPQTAGRPSASAEIAPGQADIDNRQSSIDNQQSSIVNRQSTIVNRQSSIWRSLTIYHYATKSELILILAYIGMFFLVTNTPGIRLDRIMLIIMSEGFFISFLGILQKFTGTDKIYWLIDSPNASLFGPFINRNHFAGYMGMVIPLSFGFLITRFGSIAFRKTMTWRSVLAKFESHLLGNVFLVFVMMIMISSLFLSLSRGGILSFAVAMIVFVVIVGFSRETRSIIGKGRTTTIVTLFLAFIFLFWLGIGPVLERLSDISSPVRHEVAQNTINMAKDFPLFGTGLGTFQYIYPKYNTVEAQSLWDHAHNDYVELLSDSGLIGFIIVTGGIIIFIWKILVKWWERRDSYAKGVTLGGFCGIIAILCHSVTDFNLHIPANALLLSFLLGLTWNAVNVKSTQMEE